jgi:hypothetical protein
LELLGVWKFYCAVPAIARGFLMTSEHESDRTTIRDEGGVVVRSETENDSGALVALNLLSRRAGVC